MRKEDIVKENETFFIKKTSVWAGGEVKQAHRMVPAGHWRSQNSQG